MSTPQSWSRGGRRQADEVGWGWKVTEMGWGTDKDEKGKKGGCTMTLTRFCVQKCSLISCTKPIYFFFGFVDGFLSSSTSSIISSHSDHVSSTPLPWDSTSTSIITSVAKQGSQSVTVVFDNSDKSTSPA